MPAASSVTQFSFPFIIWCCQRTGSNSLFNALRAVSEHPPAPSEPFDSRIAEDRQFAYIPGLPADRCDGALREMCGARLLIRHCYENLPDDFNRALAEVSTRAGYRHIHLQRRDEIARLISKGIAEQHGAWIPTDWTRAKYREWLSDGRTLPPLDVTALKDYHQLCVRKRKAIAGSLSVHVVRYEELFTDDPYSVLGGLASYLGFPHSSLPLMRNALGHGQDTPAIWKLIPNIEELRNAIK